MFIASGNVIFDSTSKSTKALEKKIEGCLQEVLGYPVATFIRSTAELARISEYKPFADSELTAAGHTLYIGFMADTPSESAKANFLSFATKVDDFNVDGREVYWLCRAKFSESNISGALLAKTLGMPATLRNATTVKKLAAKYPHRK